ncbi:MAG: GNAT family N-acetyltransferase [Anaerolineales bacterium]|nr:GNAT family N-acetyltransferase [Anaerolineales bacterium]
MHQINIRVIHSKLISETLKKEIISLCNRAYEEDMEPLFETFIDATHLLGYSDGVLVSHALWVTRYLQAGTDPIMHTAYIEAVATDSNYRNRGFAASLMKHLIGEIQDYELAALSPFSVEYYGRLGWEIWHGPLFIRTHDELLTSPNNEEVMIFRLPKTPALDLNAPLSAEWRAGELW